MSENNQNTPQDSNQNNNQNIPQDNNQENSQDSNQNNNQALSQNNDGTIKIDLNTCIGCGVCTSLCDTAFELNPDMGKANVKTDAPADLPCAQEGMEACPVAAISIQN